MIDRRLEMRWHYLHPQTQGGCALTSGSTVSASVAGPALCCPGAVYVEQRPSSAPKEDCAPAEPQMFSSQSSLQAEAPAAEPEASTWGVYSSSQTLDGLIAYLNPQGQRESILKRVSTF